MRAYTRAYADCRRRCLYFCRRLRPAHTRAYADCRRQSSNLLNFQGQRRPAQAFQPITKALQGHRGLTRCSDMRTYTDAYARLFILLSTVQLALCSGDAQAAASVDICAGCRRIRAWSINPALYKTHDGITTDNRHHRKRCVILLLHLIFLPYVPIHQP